MYRVSIKEKKLNDYIGIVSEQLLSEVTEAAEQLRGMRVIHINATPQGGGVAEILKSLTPLMRNVGIDSEWYTFSPNESFFRVSKTLHHCLQGSASSPSDEEIGL